MKYLYFLLLLLPLYGSSQESDLYGIVSDESGQPYAYMELTIEEINQTVKTDEDGFYKFMNVPIGDYPLVIKHPYGNVYKAIYMDGADYEYNVSIRRRIEFDEVTVAATRAVDNDPINEELINRQEIEENYSVQDFPYLLKKSASVVVNSDAGTGIGYTGIRIRGVDPSHINVTLNGIPINDSESQLVFWVNMPDLLASTESIEVQRGVGGSTFGAGDFGGSINVNTNKVRTKSYVDVNAGLGSYGTLKGNLSLGTGLMNNKFTLDGRISYIESDGYIDRASARLNSFSLTGAWLGLRQSLRLNVINGHEVTYQAWNGVPVSYVDDEKLRTFNSAGQEAVRLIMPDTANIQPYEDEVDNYTQTHVQLFYNNISSIGDWSATLHYTRGSGYFELYQADEDLARYNAIFEGDTATVRDLVERRWLDNHFIGANLGWKNTIGDLDLRAATSFNIYNGDHFGETISIPDTGVFDPPREYYRNDATKTDFNTFFKTLYHISDQWKAYLDLQFRAVNYSYDGVVRFDRQVKGEESFQFFNPKAGITFLPNDQSKIYAFFGRSNKEPNRDDFVDATTAPQHETMNNIEIGYNYRSSKAHFGMNVYGMFYENQLIPTGRINDVGEYPRTNVDESHRLGIEVEGGIQLMKGLELHANATFSQNQITEYVEYIDNWDTGLQETVVHSDTRMAFSPDVIGYAGVSYTLYGPFSSSEDEKLTIGLDHKYVGQQFLDNTENDITSLEAYFYADAFLTYSTSLPSFKVKQLDLTFKVLNLYNEFYESNGWNYRYISEDGPTPGDPYSRGEGNNVISQTGLFPQAPLHFQTSLSLKF